MELTAVAAAVDWVKHPELPRSAGLVALDRIIQASHFTPALLFHTAAAAGVAVVLAVTAEHLLA
jgi:hypothetical protein